jgi:hypothetical protein
MDLPLSRYTSVQSHRAISVSMNSVRKVLARPNDTHMMTVGSPKTDYTCYYYDTDAKRILRGLYLSVFPQSPYLRSLNPKQVYYNFLSPYPTSLPY